MPRAPPPAVKAYLDAQPAPHRASLLALRQQILRAVPDADEQISYGMPAFKVDGRFLLGIAAFKEHCSLFAGIEGTRLARESGLQGFEVNDKGTIRFPAEGKLPAALVKRIVKLRIAENRALAEARAAKRALKKRPAARPRKAPAKAAKRKAARRA